MQPTEGDSPTGISRRAYLKLAGATAAVAGTGGFAAYELDRQVNPLPNATERSSYYSGPAADRPRDAPVGTRYFAFDTGEEFVATRSGWRVSSMAAPAVHAAAIDGIADHVVKTTEGLERAFGSLERGDTVRIAGGTYRPEQWLDVEVSDVTILGASRRETLLKPADGANVGGIRIGPGPLRPPVENVYVAGIGFDGNEARMDPSVKRCHAFIVEDASHVTVRDCFATRTHPYHEHDAGGSGFTVRRPATDVAILNNYTDDIGDRSIQVAGTNVRVVGNRLTNGFDRAISLDVRHPDGFKYYARNVIVANNYGRDNSTGSIIGASQGKARRPGPGNYAIVGNVAAGTHRRTVYMGIEEGVRNVAIVGNAGRQAQFGEERAGVYVSGNVSSFVVAGNTLADYSGHGIELEGRPGEGAGFTCTGNAVLNPTASGIRVDTPEGTVANNVVEGAGGDGIEVLAGDVVVSGNTVRNVDRDGIHLETDAPAVVTANAVAEYGGDAGISVGSSESIVTANHVAAGRSPASVGIEERPGADANSFVANRLSDGDGGRDVWALRGPATRTVGNVPAVDRTHRITTTDGVASVSFDRPYDHKPVLDVQCDDPVVWAADWHRDRDGNVSGVDVRLVAPDGSRSEADARVIVHHLTV